ncbi:M23 family metallopeptidase [Streptomonospora wellingtoniae]|uniref:M23 family metallopeptidase n=1 Tax=Streptomonospora wellingtoniae TaxID=3075544 RepID=A0ABU2KNL6_9ACTN|nr:M23 family metallopeptidase [Streptomonospora sp. DSM 45055]MDT0300852.1 M23 family metallopeptidase [Streptomonospora sp. DSM 45055]
MPNPQSEKAASARSPRPARRHRGGRGTALTAALAAALLALTPMGAAQADPQEPPSPTALPDDFLAPFDCDQQWEANTRRDHSPRPAVDFQRPDALGENARASAGGTVSTVDFAEGSYGNYVEIDHAGGYSTLYAHLDSVDVAAGDDVSQGDVIGAVGNTGGSFGAHLHFEQKLDGDPVRVVLDGQEMEYYTEGDDPLVTSTNCGDGDPPDPEPAPTRLAYTGPESVSNGSAAELSATLTEEGGDPVADRTVAFTLGTADHEQTCEGTTNTDGTATCTIDAVDQPLTDDATVPLTAGFAGGDDFASAEASAEIVVTRATELAYTGPESVSNGSAPELTATLTEEGGDPVADRTVAFTLGTADHEQTCEGTTNTDGTATCTIDAVDQPLTDDATVPLTARFEGSTAFEPSEASSELRLQYVTGRSYGIKADVPVLGLPVSIDPTPDTGEVRTARAETVGPQCAQNVSALVLSANTLCTEVAAQTGPSAATSTASVEEASIGLPGLPVVGLSGVRSTSTSTCDDQSGSVDMELTVAGTPVDVGDTPNLEVDLGAAGTKLVVNEQVREDGRLTVNALHLTAPGGVDVVVASSTSAARNCG